MQLYRRKGSRYWWARGRDSNGEAWRQSTKQTDKRAAGVVGRRIELERAVPPDVPALPLGEALAMLEAHKRRKGVSEATWDVFRTKVGHLVRVLGETFDLSGIRLADSEAYMDQRVSEGVGLHTVAKELGHLKSALRVARQHDRFPRDPRVVWPAELDNVYTPRDRWLTPAEYAALLSQATPYRAEYLATYCYTGIRRSELYRIEAQHLDLDAQTILVMGTKTEEAERVIPAHEGIWSMLLRRAQETPTGPLFVEWPKSRQRETVNTWCAKAGIERVTTNDLRRTFASWLCNAHVPEIVTVQLMGHTSSAMVRRVYAQLTVGTKRAAVDKLPPLGVTAETVHDAVHETRGVPQNHTGFPGRLRSVK